MGKSLYLECKSGVSGDMVVGALLDAGADADKLSRILADLSVGGFSVSIGRTSVCGLDACDFDVKLDAELENRDHDMDYLYGNLDDECHADTEGLPTHADHPAEPARNPEGAGEHAHHHEHHHAHRTLADVLEIVDRAGLSSRAHATARRIFEIIAEAEAAAHGVPVDKVHLHEVGAIDSIVDVISCAFCLDDLDVERVYVSPLYEGTGRVRTQHGVLPVPVPAVVQIAARYDLELELGDRTGEFVTPTGAAICAAVGCREPLPSPLAIEGIGIGAGKRAYDPPSFVRAMIIRACGAEPIASGNFEGGSDSAVWKLECDIDDCSAEAIGYALSRLMDAGAREAHALPLTMKSSRPGTQIQVICDEEHRHQLEEILFSDTTTIGVRRVAMQRTVLERTIDEVATPLGKARVKVVTLPDGRKRAYPEHREVARLAKENRVSYQEALRAVLASASHMRTKA